MALVIRHNNETPKANIERLAPVVFKMHLLSVGVDVYLVRLLPQGLGPEDFKDLVIPISDVSYDSTSASAFLVPSPAFAASYEGNSPRLVGTFLTALLGTLEYCVSTSTSRLTCLSAGIRLCHRSLTGI